MQIHESSQVIPLPGVPTLFLDMKTEEDITNSNDPRPPQDFRCFRLHKVLYLGGGMTTGLVAILHLRGVTLFHWTSVQKQVLPPELEKVAQLTVTLANSANCLLPCWLVPSCPKRALVWGTVVRGFVRQDLC